MVLFKRNAENERKEQHFTWTLILCCMYLMGRFCHLLINLLSLISICIRPAAETLVINTATGLRFDLLMGFAELSREFLPIAANTSEINGKLFAVTYLILSLIAYDLPLLLIAWRGYQILHTMEHSWSPFTLKIAEHICWIGRISLFIGLFHKLIIQVGMSAAIDHRFYFENFCEMSWILAGVILLLVSDIFRKGCILQKEVDETL